MLRPSNSAVLFIFLYFTLSVYTATAQYSFSGKITDQADIPIGAATVSLFTVADSALQKIALSEENGLFHFEKLLLKNYYVRISRLNFSDTLIAIEQSVLSARDSNIKIRLNAIGKNLDGVTVSSAKPLVEHKIDRTIFNVENSVSSIGADALEALQKAPRVIVNADNIAIAGKSGVKVMLNDQMLELSGEDLMEFLKSISADDISRIEVITNPPSFYDAEGNSGIINIVLKKSRKKGVTGNIRAGYTQNNYGTTNAGGNFNYSNDKISFYSSLSADRGAEAVAESMEIIYPTQLWTKYNTRRVEIANINGTAGADYKWSKKTTLGFMYNGSYNGPNFRGHINNPIYNKSGNIDSTIDTHTHTIQSTANNSLNLNLQHLFGSSGVKLTADADYFSSTNNKDRDVLSTTNTPDTSRFTQTKSYAMQQITVATIKGDLKIPIKFTIITMGGKLSFIENNTPANYYNVINGTLYPDAGNTNHFIYSENTQALYINANKDYKKWGYQLGLRGEFTESKGVSATLTQANTNSYFRLFPTAFLTYKMNEDNNFSISYGRRIDRPEYWRTNPFKYYSTPYYYQEGNPFLQPSYSNNIEITHSYKDILASAIFFHNMTNAVEEITIVSDTSNLVVIKYRNYMTIYSYGLSESITLNMLKWFESNTQITVYHTDAYSDYPGTSPLTRSFSANISTDNTITFNQAKTIMGEISYTYQFPEVEHILRYQAHSGLDIGVKLVTTNKKWIFSINATDIFHTEELYYRTSINSVPIYNYGYYDLRGVRMNLNYKFGKNKTGVSQHLSGNEEETKRAR